MVKVCRVQKVFQLADRLVLVTDMVGSLRELTRGGTVELKRPDGSRVRTKTWLELPSPPSDDRPVSFSIEPHFKKADIPDGTEVWLEEAELPTERRHSA